MSRDEFGGETRRKATRVATVIAVGAALIFAWIANVVEVGPVGPDADILVAVASARRLAIDRVMVAATMVGAGLPTVVIGSIFAVGLMRWRHRPEALFVIVAVAGSVVLTPVAKAAFARPRPAADLVTRVAEAGGFSFPSGHALSAMVLYTAIALATASIESGRWRFVTAALAIVMIPTMGFTRVYLGVHYPSDVLGGWALGAAWVWSVYLGYLYATPQRLIKTDR